jgi:hypothetical protein
MNKSKKEKSQKKHKVFKENTLGNSMKKLRPIKKYSGVWMIKLTPIDAQDLQLKEGDLIDISYIKKEELKDKEEKK